MTFLTRDAPILNYTKQSCTRNITINSPNTIIRAFFNSVLILFLELGKKLLIPGNQKSTRTISSSTFIPPLPKGFFGPDVTDGRNNPVNFKVPASAIP